MINIKYVTLLLVFSILCCEPAIAVQIGDFNSRNPNLIQDNSPNGSNVFIKIIVNPHSDMKKLKYITKNNSTTNQSTNRIKHCLSKPITQKQVHHNINKIKILNNTQKFHKKTLNHTNYNKTEPNTNAITGNITYYITDNTTEDNATNIIADNSTNNTSENSTNDVTNNTGNNTTNTTFNNKTNITDTENKELEESTKDKVTDTLLAIGYASAAIAAACAMNPEPLVSKIICAIAVTVAVASFIAVICVKWLW